MTENIWGDELAQPAREIIKYARLAWEKGFAGGTGGNISVRVGDRVLITATNSPLRETTPEQLILCGLDGTVLQAAPGQRPSKETAFHTAVYRQRDDARCVFHLHPPYSIVWGLTGAPLPMLTESARLKLKQVPLIPEGRPGTAELAEKVSRSVAEAPADTRAFFMRGHGILVTGSDPEDCFHTCELLEDSAKIAVLSRLTAAVEKA